jgi:succinate dehydrogenase / fumarate reductase cytochrome b subunit
MRLVFWRAPLKPWSWLVSTNPRKGLAALFHSSIGNKVLMGLTGLGLIGFLVAHMAGNLLALAGKPEPINAYGAKLYSLGPVLWGMRLGLLGLFLLHLHLAAKTYLGNKAARPTGYFCNTSTEATWAAKNMIVTGAVILLFVVVHIAHFTVGVVRTGEGFGAAYQSHDVYGMLIRAFSNPLVAACYLAAVAAVCLHVSHGFASVFKSLGASHPRLVDLACKASYGLAGLLCLGFASIPVAVYLKIIH